MKIAVTVHIASTLDLVWAAFNEPAHILQWDASNAWRTTDVTNDLRVGGLLELHMEGASDKDGFHHRAIYTQVEPLRLLEWRTEEGQLVRVDLRQTADGVIVSQVFDNAPEPSIEEQRQDWQGVLDSFARYAASIGP